MRKGQRLDLRSRVGAMTQKFPFFHRFMVFLYHIAVLEIWPRIRRLSRPHKVQADLGSFLSLQAIRTLKFDLSSPTDARDLISLLKKENLSFYEGGWTIYLPPSNHLSELIPGLQDYPEQSGVKILKHLEPPLSAHYTPDFLRPTPGAKAVRSRTPRPQELLRVAGALANEGLGPLVYDLVELHIGSTVCTAFIIEHVSSEGTVSSEDYKIFTEKLDVMLEKGCLDVAHGDYRLSNDFKEPDCNGNLLKGANNRCFYVDFQSFIFADEVRGLKSWAQENSEGILFGPRRLGKTKDYLYQMVPGLGDAKRETLVRWEIIDALLDDGGVKLSNRVVFDIGCNSGLMSYYGLSRGSRWAYGWDRPAIATASQVLLRLLGASRWNVFGTEINSSTDFQQFISENSCKDFDGVLFYFAISNHIGFPAGVAQLPWKYCIYEGHSGQGIKASIDKIKHSGWEKGENIEILATKSVIDGDSPVRSLILFSRFS